jgi:hypothetical protein
MSSTMRVDHHTHNKSISSYSSSINRSNNENTNPNCTKMSVTFCLEKNREYKSSTHLYKDQTRIAALCFYSKQDYARFRQQRQESVHDLEEQQDNTYKRVTIRTYEACCKATSDALPVLNRGEGLFFMMQCRDARVLGIETLAFQSVTRKQESLRRQLNDVVLSLQQDVHVDDELIRAQSECVSLSSRLFARELGAAVAGGTQ